MRVIEPSTWVPQPWRNGAGVTHELVRWPETDPFAIRISVADVTAPAPFSTFAGYTRWLYLLDGGPVILAIDGAETVLADAGDGVMFAGEASVAATVVARPSRDLNVMVRSTLTARCEILRGCPTMGSDPIVGHTTGHAVFAISGEVTVQGSVLRRDGCVWAIDERARVELAPGAIAAILVVER